MRLLPFYYYFPTIRGLWKNYLNKEAIFPFYASFKITSRCYFNCTFCNMRKNVTKDLPTGEIKKILDTISRSPVLMTSFEGGEPLLRDDIGELLRYARKCMFYLLFTTSVRNLMDYPMEEYSRYIDFLHVSIDEGHDNLEMFDLLPELAKLPTQVSVQVVVTKDTIDTLDKKVEVCHQYGIGIVIIAATAMEGAEDCFPDINRLEERIGYLRKRYPNTIHTPKGYFDSYKKHNCSSASIIIAPDGCLYYPCHILEKKGPNLREKDLTSWLTSREAYKSRIEMKGCDRNCGWYQYYSINSYLSLKSAFKILKLLMYRKK